MTAGPFVGFPGRAPGGASERKAYPRIMATEHDRFDELAVGHVLGGLPASDASDFRSHLTGCRDCRARVAELRDLASDLAAAERDELARARVKTEVARRQEGEAAATPAWNVSLRAVTALLVFAVLTTLALAFWNFQLRDQNAQLLDVTATREAILEGLASGTPVETTRSGGATGVVVVDATHVTADLAGLPTPAEDEVLVAWLLGDGPTDHYYREFSSRQLQEGRIAFRDPHRQTDRLVITLEDGPRGDEPAGRELVSAELSPRG